MPASLVLSELRYRKEIMARLKQTCGKHGRELPAYRPAWADTPARTLLGAILLAAMAIAWRVL